MKRKINDKRWPTKLGQAELNFKQGISFSKGDETSSKVDEQQVMSGRQAKRRKDKNIPKKVQKKFKNLLLFFASPVIGLTLNFKFLSEQPTEVSGCVAEHEQFKTFQTIVSQAMLVCKMCRRKGYQCGNESNFPDDKNVKEQYDGRKVGRTEAKN